MPQVVAGSGRIGGVASTNTITLAIPANVQVGDLVLAVFEMDSGNGTQMNGLTGFTRRRSQASNSGNSNHAELLYKYITQADITAGSWTFTLNGNKGTCSATMMAFRGVSQTDTFDAGAADQQGAGSPRTAPTITTVTDNCLLVYSLGIIANVDGTSNALTNIQTHSRTGASTAIGSRPLAVPGDSPATQWTFSATGQLLLMVDALRGVPEPSLQEITGAGGIASAEAFDTPVVFSGVLHRGSSGYDSAAASSDTFNVTLPPLTQAGDLLLVNITYSLQASLVLPTGWTMVRDVVTSGTSGRNGHALMYKYATALDAGATLTLSTANAIASRWAVTVSAFYQVNQWEPFAPQGFQAMYGEVASTTTYDTAGALKSQPVVRPVVFVSTWIGTSPSSQLFKDTLPTGIPHPGGLPDWRIHGEALNTSGNFFYSAVITRYPLTDAELDFDPITLTFTRSTTNFSTFVMLLNPKTLASTKEVTNAGGIASAESFGTPDFRGRVKRVAVTSTNDGGVTRVTSIGVTLPTAIRAGDLLYMTVLYDINSATFVAMNDVPGWTKARANAINTSLGMYEWYKIADGSEAGSVVTLSGAQALWTVGVVVLRGVHTSAPLADFDRTFVNNVSSTAVNFPAMAPPVEGDAIMLTANLFAPVSAFGSIGAIAGFTSLFAEVAQVGSRYIYTKGFMKEDVTPVDVGPWSTTTNTNYTHGWHITRRIRARPNPLPATQEITGAGNIGSAENFPTPEVLRVPLVTMASNYAAPSPAGATSFTPIYTGQVGHVAGEMMVAIIGFNGNPNIIQMPAGWQMLASDYHVQAGVGNSLVILYKFYDGVEDTSPTFIWDGVARSYAGQALVIRSVDNILPFGGGSSGFVYEDDSFQASLAIFDPNIYEMYSLKINHVAAVKNSGSAPTLTRAAPEVAMSSTTANMTGQVRTGASWRERVTALGVYDQANTVSNLNTSHISGTVVLNGPNFRGLSVTSAGNIASAEAFGSPTVTAYIGPPQLRAASSAKLSTGGSSLVLNKPTGVVQGDYMLCTIQVEHTVHSTGQTTIFTPPEGWTVVLDIDGWSARIVVWQKWAGASEPTNYTWAFARSPVAATQYAQGHIVAYQRVSTARPVGRIDSQARDVNNSQLMESYPIEAFPLWTPDSLHLVIVDLYSIDDQGGAVADIIPEVGYTEVVETFVDMTPTFTVNRTLNLSQRLHRSPLASPGIRTWNRDAGQHYFVSGQLSLLPLYGWIDNAGAIPTAEAFGSPDLGFIAPTSIASAEAFGDPSVLSAISPSEILSEEDFGLPQMVTGTVGATKEITGVGGIVTQEIFEAPRAEYITSRSDPVLYGLPDEAIEIVDARSRTSKTFLMPDGYLVKVISQQLHYPSAVGDMLDLDFSFRDIGGSMYIMDQHDFEIRVYAGIAGPYIQVIDRTLMQGIRIRLPEQPYSVSGNTVRFMWGGYDCRYQVRKRGLKFATDVTHRTGGSAFSFEYELIGGAPHPAIDVDGNLVSSFFVIPRAFAQTADGDKKLGTPWALVATPEQIIEHPVPYDPDRPSTEQPLPPPPTIIPEKHEFQFSIADNDWESESFPYMIDPTLDMAITVDAQDDAVNRTGGAYPPTGGYTWYTGLASIIARREKVAARFNTTVGLMKFDTRQIPDDAILKGAKFRGRVVSAQSVNGRSATLQWASWTTGVTTSWTNTASGTAHGGIAINSLTPGQDIQLDLIGVSNAVINRAGDSFLKLHVSGGAPTGVNRIDIASNEDPVLPPPMLLVEYEEAAAYRSTSQVGTTSPVGSITIPKPEETVERDLLLCCVFAYPQANTSRVTITPPTGWADFPGTGAIIDYPTWGRAHLFYRFTDETDDPKTGYTFTFNQSAVAVATMLNYYGVQDTEANVATYLNTNAGTVVPSPAKVTTGQKDRVVRFAGGHSNSLGGSWTPAAPLMERADIANSGTGLVGVSMEAADEVQASAGTSAAKNHTVTASRTRRWAMTVVLNPSYYIYPVQPIYSEEVFGTPTIDPRPVNLFPPSIASAESIGVPMVRHQLGAYPIDSAEAFGIPRLYPGTSPVSIPTQEVFGTPQVVPLASYRDVEGIPSAEAFGIPHMRHILGQFGLASAETFGVPALTLVLPPTDVLVARARQESLVLSGERGEIMYEPKLWISNQWGDELRELPGVISASVDLSNYRDNTWGLELRCEMSDAFDPLTDFVLATLDVAADRDPWRRYPLGLYRFDLPKGQDEPENSFWDLVGASPEWLLTRRTDINGFTVKKGTSLFTAVRKVFNDLNIPLSRLTMPPNAQDKIFKKGVKFDPLKDQDGALYIRILNQLLSMAGMGAIQTTAGGQFFFNPIVPFENKHATVRYGPRAHGGDDMILYEAITRDVDYSRFANEVFVYNSNTTSGLEEKTKPIKAVARNMSEDSPVSIPNLGYTVTKTITQDEITDQDAANKLARAELSRSTAYHLKRTIHTIPDPRRGPDEAYRLEAYSTLDIPILEGKWQSIGWKLPLSPNPADMIMEHQVSRNEDF